MKVITHNTPENREAWLAARMDGIGSSDAAAIVGRNPYQGPMGVYASKVGLDEPEESDASESAYWGHVLQEQVLKRFGEKSGRPVDTWEMLVSHDERDWQLATCDGQQVHDDGRKGLVECKVTRFDWKNVLPEMVYIQVQHQLSVTDLPFASVAVLQLIAGGWRFDYIDVERNETFIDALVKAEHDFWFDHVQRMLAPAVDGHKETGKILAKMYPPAPEEKVINLDSELQTLHDWRELRERGKAMKAEELRCKHKLQAVMQDAHVGLFSTGDKVTWKPREDGVRVFNLRESK